MTAIAKACRYPDKILCIVPYLMGQLCKLASLELQLELQEVLTSARMISSISSALLVRRTERIAARHGMAAWPQGMAASMKNVLTLLTLGRILRLINKNNPYLYGPGHADNWLEK